VSDVELILELSKLCREDEDKPVFDQKFNPTDPVAIEIVMHEADFAVEAYMDKWTRLYRHRFQQPEVYDNFVREYQMRVRANLKRMIGAAQRYIQDEIENEEGDDDGGV
jgi:hypothetical protein